MALVMLCLVFDCWTGEIEDAPVGEVTDCAVAGEY